MALKLRAQRPRAEGVGGADKKAGRRGNAILPYMCAPGSFKRMLGAGSTGRAAREFADEANRSEALG